MSEPKKQADHPPLRLLPVPEVRFSASDEWLLLQDAVIQTDLHFNIIGWNSPAEVLYGFTDALGKNLFTILDLQFVKGSLEDLKLEMACSSCWTGELIFTKHNGERIFFRTTANYMVNEKKRPVSILVVSHNISEEKRKEQRLQVTETEYKTLVNTLYDGVVLMKSDGRIGACNRQAAKILGLPEEQLQGRYVASSAWNAFRQDGTPFPPEEFPAQITLRTGMEQRDVVMGLKRPDGKLVWISINSRPIFTKEDTAPEAVVVSFKDITDDLEKQEKLKRTETLFTTFINNSQTAAWIYDEEGNVLLANAVYDRIINAPPGGSVGRNIRELFPPDFARMLMERNLDFLETGSHAAAPKELVQADGTVRTFVSYLFKLDPVGGKRLIGGQALDITETRAAVLKLEKSEALFRTFMSSTPTLSWIYDESGRLLFANPRFMAELGFTADAIGRNFRELAMNDGVRELVESRISEVLEHDTRTLFDDVIVRQNDEKRYYAAHWFLIPMPDGSRLIGGHAEDITEKKVNNARLRELKERYELALKATSDAVWDYDVVNNVITRGPRFAPLSGYSPEEIEPTLEWWFRRIHPDERDSVKRRFEAFLERKDETWSDEYRFQYADGTYRHILDEAFAIYRDDRLVRLVGAIQDVTDQRELERRLIEEQVEKHKQITFAAIRAQELERDAISKELHDNINQILFSAKLYMNTARHQPAGREELLDRAIEYQMLAIEEIRKLSKALSTSLVQSFGLRENVEGIVYTLQHLQHLEVDFQFSESLEEKLSNEQKLMLLRVVQEQTNNIIKYAKASHVLIDIADYQEQASLFIRDNGIGFDMLQRPNGIGLSNIRNRAVALNGKVKITSAPGEGCRLELIFPLEEKEAR